MLAQILQRKDAKGQRRKGRNIFIQIADTWSLLKNGDRDLLHYFPFATLHLCVFALILLSLSCSTKPTDLRTLVPADTLVYLETNDLAAALQPIVDSIPFAQVAKSKPDFSALKGVQLAVAVTGFETTEEKLTDENSVGRVQPRFVAVADTHAWNWQAVKFAELKLGSFVEDIYDSEPTLEKSDKNGGTYFTWKAKDGRKAYALVIDSLIYFGNDESSIEKCLAVKRGEADSIAKTGKVQSVSQGTLASGYLSTDGVAQIASIVGMKFASEAGEDSEVQSAIAGILPKLLRSSVTEINWTATRTEQGIEDKYLVSMPGDVANVLSETMTPSGNPTVSLLDLLPSSLPSITIYDLRNPQVAWRSLILVAGKQTDPMSARVIATASSLFFEPYGVSDGETFLSAVGSTIITGRTDDDVDGVVVVAGVTDKDKLLKSLESALKPKEIAFENGRLNIWQSDDGDLSAFIEENSIVLGETTSLLKCCVNEHGRPSPNPDLTRMKNNSVASSKTISKDLAAISQIVEMLAEKKSDDAKAESTYLTETRFTKTGMERRTVSDFGLIGSIIAQLATEQ